MQQQMGFDLDYVDPVTHVAVPWAKADPVLLARIFAARWKIIDVETTGLNPASKEQKFSGKQYQRGIDSELRLRVMSVLYPAPEGWPVTTGILVESFDMDPLSEEDRVAVCSACFTNVVIAHNAGFDAYWTRTYATTSPLLLLDSMLMSRILYPEQPIVMARMCNDENEDLDLKTEATNMFMGGASGWSLAHLAVGRLRKILPKAMQGPKNWCEPFLTQKAYDYATDDCRTVLELLMSLFEISDPANLLTRYYELREIHTPLQIVEPQVWDIVQMRETGMPWSQDEAEAYVLQQWEKVKVLSQKMVELEPSLQPYAKALADPGAGINAALKKAIGDAFSSRGLELEMTEKTGTFKIGEKDLRRVKAAITPDSKALFDTWTTLNRAKKAGGMAQEVSKYAARSYDGRLHPNTGHGPVTGRLSSSEPNCFSGDTEILTIDGWVRFDELRTGVAVAQYDEGQLQFVLPTEITRQNWSGTLVHNVTNNIDLLCTPMHRCHVVNPKTNKAEVFEAYKYPAGYRQVHAMDYSGPGIMVSDAEIREITRAQDGTGEMTPAALEFLDDNGNFSSALLGMTSSQIQRFLAEIESESTAFKGSGNKFSYHTGSESRATWVQLMYCLSGVTAWVVPVKARGSDVTKYVVKGVNRHTTSTKSVKQESVNFDGIVYCVSVPSEFIVVRRNGCIVVTGQCQQFPRDQGFRNSVRARPGYKIVSADYSALDMRVGAALAIRAQQQVVDAYMGDHNVPPDVMRIISRVLEERVSAAAAKVLEDEANLKFAKCKEGREAAMEGGKDASRKYWEGYRILQRSTLLSGFQRCLAEVRERAKEAGTPEWGSLRDAFNIEGMDIHTWTALDMMGENPKALFDGLSGEDVAKELKRWKGILGDKRQTGKVGNLSLLYAMQARGLMDAAAKNYNIHWTIEEATEVREKWLAAFVEIDLWHKWTELNPVETVMIPDKDRGGRFGKKAVYASKTLGDRLIYAFGLNAALSYEDQSTGADILGKVMADFREYPGVFATIINQVHDEVLFEIPEAVLDEYNEIIGRVMTDAAEHFLRPFGVKAGCEPEAGDVWLKG